MLAMFVHRWSFTDSKSESDFGVLVRSAESHTLTKGGKGWLIHFTPPLLDINQNEMSGWSAICFGVTNHCIKEIKLKSLKRYRSSGRER